MPKVIDLFPGLGADAARFCREHPDPALLLEPHGEGRSAVDTPSLPQSTIVAPTETVGAGSTSVLGPLEAARQLAQLHVAVHPDARVEWLTKSDRNPFGALITVGRARNNDLVIAHATVSKVHVIFTKAGQHWQVSDERSSNGTFLNGVRLAQGEKRAISPGDLLRLGPDIVGRFFDAESLFDFLALARKQAVKAR